MNDYDFLFNTLLNAKHKLSEKLDDDFPDDMELWDVEKSISEKIGELYSLLKSKHIIERD